MNLWIGGNGGILEKREVVEVDEEAKREVRVWEESRKRRRS